MCGMKGYVYLAHAHDDLYKIGVSNWLAGRLTSVRPQSKIVCTLEANHPFFLEKVLHRNFANQADRTHGREWFKLSLSDIVWVGSLEHRLPLNSSTEDWRPLLYDVFTQFERPKSGKLSLTPKKVQRENSGKILTIPEAAAKKGITRQAMHAAVRSQKVRTVKFKVTQIGIRLEDLEDYRPDYERQARAANHTR